MPDLTNIQGWDGSSWVPLLCNAAGKLIIDPSEILEATPTDGETAKAAQSDWSFDHNANVSAHHAKYTDAEAIAAAKTDPTLLNYLQGARVYHNAAQSIANDTFVFLAFNSERYDTDGIHDTVTDNSRLTCKTAGKYIISMNVRWPGNAVGVRDASIQLNRTVNIATVYQDSPGTTVFYGSASTVYDLAVGDYLEVRVYQDSGGTLAINSVGNISPEFAMQRIG